MIFSVKSLIYTCVAGAIGLIFYFIFGKIFKLSWLGWGLTAICAVIGFAVGTFKIPSNNGTALTRKLGGENIDGAILRWIKFRKKGNLIYTYLGAKEKNNG